ncbi:MAG TPA: hypothetical protein PKA58_35295 [Polyangium sp.]|nr:hypothetical protein [Polyangium sp.]
MKSKLSLLAAIVVSGLGALTTGCYAETGYVVTNDAYAYDYAEPALVSAGPDVWIVRGQPSVYYADNTYWTYSGSGWYRSSYANGGWVAVNTAPVIVVNHHHSVHHVTHRVVAQPRVVHRPAQPHIVHRPARPHVHLAQSDAQVRAPASKPAASVRVSGSVHVSAKPSHSVRTTARPSIRVAGSGHSSHSSSSRSHHR